MHTRVHVIPTCIIQCFFLQETADLSTTFTLGKASQNTTSLTHQRPPSSKLFSKEGSNSPPTHRPPTGRNTCRLDPIDTGLESNRTTARCMHSPNGKKNAPLIRDLRDLVPSCGTLPPPNLPPGSNLARRHKSLPNGVINRDLPTRNGLRKKTSSGNGSPQLSPIGSATLTKGLGALDSVKQQLLPQPVPPGGDLSVSWPHSHSGARSIKGHSKKTSEQITADPLKAVGGGERVDICVC